MRRFVESKPEETVMLETLHHVALLEPVRLLPGERVLIHVEIERMPRDQDHRLVVWKEVRP